MSPRLSPNKRQAEDERDAAENRIGNKKRSQAGDKLDSALALKHFHGYGSNSLMPRHETHIFTAIKETEYVVTKPFHLIHVCEIRVQ